MGWWSHNIMGGDMPMDIEHDWKDTFGNELPLSSAVEKFIDALIEEYPENDRNNVVFCSTFLALKTGTWVDKVLHRRVIDAVKDEIENNIEQWEDPLERVRVLEALLELIMENRIKPGAHSKLIAKLCELE